jgi:hypothetical protein
LLTGVKASNLPLLLPIAWAMAPGLSLLKERLAGSIGILLLSLMISFVPTAALNYHYSGDWTGDPANVDKLKIQEPLAGILGNGLQLGLQSLEPPFLPVAHAVENWLWDRFPDSLRAILMKGFPRFVIGFRELPQEESAGVGIGITVMAFASIIFAWRYRRRHQAVPLTSIQRSGMTLGLLTWAALLVFMAKMGSEATSRLIAPYYPLLLLPFLLNPAQNVLVVHRAWYNTLGVCASIVALVAVILTPSRPLWPAETFFDWAAQHFPSNSLVTRAQTTYSVYRCRNDVFASLRNSIPDSVQVIGLIEGTDDPETSLWRPFGVRRVVDVRECNRIKETQLGWLVVKNSEIGNGSDQDFQKWLQRDGGVVVSQRDITEKAARGPETWTVVHFPAPADAKAS